METNLTEELNAFGRGRSQNETLQMNGGESVSEKARTRVLVC